MSVSQVTVHRSSSHTFFFVTLNTSSPPDFCVIASGRLLLSIYVFLLSMFLPDSPLFYQGMVEMLGVL